MAPPAERRRFTRIAIEVEAALVDTQTRKRLPVKILDASLKGVALERPADFRGKAGKSYRLDISSRAAKIFIQMEGTLTHVDTARLGFRWDLIDASSMADLRRLLAPHLKDETLLHREIMEVVRAADDDS
jgi:hypothetical protein